MARASDRRDVGQVPAPLVAAPAPPLVELRELLDEAARLDPVPSLARARAARGAYADLRRLLREAQPTATVPEDPEPVPVGRVLEVVRRLVAAPWPWRSAVFEGWTIAALPRVRELLAELRPRVGDENHRRLLEGAAARAAQGWK